MRGWLGRRGRHGGVKPARDGLGAETAEATPGALPCPAPHWPTPNCAGRRRGTYSPPVCRCCCSLALALGLFRSTRFTACAVLSVFCVFNCAYIGLDVFYMHYSFICLSFISHVCLSFDPFFCLFIFIFIFLLLHLFLQHVGENPPSPMCLLGITKTGCFENLPLQGTASLRLPPPPCRRLG